MNPTVTANPKSAEKRLLTYPGFLLLFLGSTIGKLGDRLYQTAMATTALVVFAGSAAEDQLSLIQVVATVPLLFAYFVIGALIDNADRRRLMSRIMAVKAGLVLMFVPFLWSMRGGDFRPIYDHWYLGLAMVFLISLIDAPFSPARAAAVPDVSPEEKKQLGASLIATSGLLSTLVGSLGLFLARTDYLGPVNTIGLAFGCFVICSILIRMLPDAVAVPGVSRKSADEHGAGGLSGKRGATKYVKELIDGFSYVFNTRGLPQLIIFETVFWCVTTGFYVVFSYFLSAKLKLRPDLISGALSWVLCAAGIGLFTGAITVGRLCRRVSPVITFPFSCLIMGLGASFIFSIPADVSISSGPNPPELRHGDWVALLNESRETFAQVEAFTPIKPDTTTIRVHRQPKDPGENVPRTGLILYVGNLQTLRLLTMCFCAFILGFGGGFMLGRVDADILTISDPKMRGRVFSIKSASFTVSIICVIALLTHYRFIKPGVVNWLGTGLFLAMIPAIIMGWFVDVAIWSDRGDSELPGPLHLAGYWVTRALCLLILKILFRLEAKGTENIPANGPVVLAANHASFIDPILLGCCVGRTVQYIMHASYYRSLAHPFFRFLRCIPVDEKSQLGAIKAGMRSLNQNACIGIFPEGHVSPNGKLQMPMSGALFLAQRSGATVVPAVIKGNYAAFPRHAWVPRPKKVTVIVGKPFTVGKDLSRKQVAELTDGLMVWMAETLSLEAPPKSADKERDRVAKHVDAAGDGAAIVDKS